MSGPRRSERGSIVAVLLVAIIATMLAFAFVGTMEFGLRDSRRAGSSANALQLADAGLNDAMKTIPHLSSGLAHPIRWRFLPSGAQAGTAGGRPPGRQPHEGAR